MARMPITGRNKRTFSPRKGAFPFRLTDRGVQRMPCGNPPPFSFCERQKENGGGAVKRKNAKSLGDPDAKRPLPQRDAALNRSAQKPSTPHVSTGGVPIKPPNPQPRAAQRGHRAKTALDQLLFPRSERCPGSRGTLQGKRIPTAGVRTGLGMTEVKHCHCEERSDAAIRNSRLTLVPRRAATAQSPAPELPGHPRPRLPQSRMF